MRLQILWQVLVCTHTGRLEVSPAKSRKRMVTKVQWLFLKDVRQLCCVFLDTEPPNLCHFCGRAQKSWDQYEYDLQKLRSVMQRSEKTKVRRSEKFKSKFLISGVRTLWNLRIGLRRRSKDRSGWARGDAWRLAQKILKLKETDKATFFSPANEWCLPASSVMKPEEREFVVDPGASMHMLRRKDLNSASLETVRVSKSPTTAVTANGEVHTKEEGTVYVKELDLFVTVKLLEDTLAVLSLGKRQDHGYSYERTSGQKPQLIRDGRRIKCNTANYVPIVVPGLSTSSWSSAVYYHSMG